MVRMSVAKSAK